MDHDLRKSSFAASVLAVARPQLEIITRDEAMRRNGGRRTRPSVNPSGNSLSTKSRGSFQDSALSSPSRLSRSLRYYSISILVLETAVIFAVRYYKVNRQFPSSRKTLIIHRFS